MASVKYNEMIQLKCTVKSKLKEAKYLKGFHHNKRNRSASALHDAINDGNLEQIENELKRKDPTKDLNKQNCSSGYSFLHEAARRNNSQIIKTLVKHGVQVNLRSSDGQQLTPLHIAARFNCYHSACALLEHGADPTVTTSQGTSPLHYVARRGNKRMVQLFLNDFKVEIDARDDSYLTPLHHACIHGNSQAIQLLLERNADVQAKTADCMLPLHFAVNNACNSDAVEMILRKVSSLKLDVSEYVNSTDQDENTPLHLAVEANNLEATKLCLDAGANVNFVRANSMTALHIATLKGNVEMVELLVTHGADVKAKDSEMKTCFHRAASFNRVDILKYLLTKCGELETADYRNRTAFLEAVACGQTAAAEFLLQAGADAHAVDSSLKNCIHMAVENQQLETLNMLLDKEEVSENLCRTDIFERIPLHYAAFNDNHKILEVMLSKHESGKLISLQDADHQSPLHLSAISGFASNVEALGRVMQGLNERDDNRQTPLHKAAMSGNSKVCKILLRMGADVDSKDVNRWTPLMWATKEGCLKSVQVLLNNQAALDSTDTEGNTALHIACIYGLPAIVNLLLDVGAQATLRNKDGRGCMDLAVLFDMPDVAQAFVKHKRWQEIMNDKDFNGHTCMKLLIRYFPESALLIMNKCINQSKTSTAARQTVTYDFHLLDPGPDDLACVHGKRFFGPRQMVKYRRQDLLRHPLTVNLLESKWTSFGRPFFQLNCLFYLIYVICYSVFVVKEREQLVFQEHGVNKTIIPTSNFAALTKSPYLSVIPPFIVAYLSFHMIKEILKIATLRFRYFFELGSYIEWAAYITCMMFIGSHLSTQPKYRLNTHLTWILGAISIFLSYMNLILLVSRFRRLGIYIFMFSQVTKTVIHVIAAFSIFIIAFAIVFFILFKEQDSFRTFYLSLVKVVVMMVGEFEYKDIFIDSASQLKSAGRPLNPFPNTALVFCCIFILLISVVLMNLMIGLAIGDIETIQQNAALESIAMQVKFVADIEDKYPRFITRRFYKAQLTIEKKINIRSKLERLLQQLLHGAFLPWETVTMVSDDEMTTDQQYEKLRAQLSKAQKRIKDLVSTVNKQNTMLRELVEKMEPCDSNESKTSFEETDEEMDKID